MQCEVRWGSGASQILRTFEAWGGYIHIPLCADSVQVTFRAVNAYARDTTPLAKGIVVRGRAFIADGVEGITRPTIWTQPTLLTDGNPVQIYTIPKRVVTIEGYRSDIVVAGQVFILSFDQIVKPGAGDLAHETGPIPSIGGTIKFPYLDSDGYTNGLWLALSTTTPLFTPIVAGPAPVTAVCRVEELIG